MSKLKVVPKVMPGLSIRAKDLERRLGSRSITVDASGNQYSTDAQVTEISRMSRTDLMRSHVNEVSRVQKLKDSLNEEQGRARKAAELARIEKIKAEAIAEHVKAKGNG